MRVTQSLHSGRVLGFLIALLALAAPAASASAATPIDLGAGETSPRVIVDSAGRGYLTWEGRDETHLAEEEVLYCRLDPGATSCSASKAFGHSSGSEYAAGSAPLLDASGNALVLEDRFGTGPVQAKRLYSAAEGFATGWAVGTTDPTGLVPDFTDAVYVPAGTVASTPRVITINGGPVTGGGQLQATGAIGTTASGLKDFSVTAGAGGGHSTTTAAIGLAGSILVTAYIDLDESNILKWREYNGNGGGSVAALNESANWTPPANFGVGADNVVLAGGPGGLYAAYDAPGTGTVMLVQFTGGGWTAPIPISDTGTVNGWFSLSEDEAGVLHLAWADPSGSLRYRYARDSSNNSFTNPQTLTTGPGFREPHLAVDAAGNGWVAWREFNGGNPAHVLAMPVAPGEPPLPTPPAPPATTPSLYKGPTKTTGVAVGKGLRAVLTTPKSCVAGGQNFQASVGVKRKGSRAHKASYSVPKVSFFLNGKLLFTDKKKPFRATYATSGIAAGTSLLVTAKISVLLKKGHRHSTVRKTLKARVATC
jgi:hypothetical protein